MKIGVFGDGFAAWRALWPTYLQDYGHNCNAHGDPDSSIWFSVRRMQKYAQNHDFLIWCVTAPGRLSLETKDWLPPYNRVHYNWVDPTTTQHQDVRHLQEVFRDYYLHLVDPEEDNLLYSSLVYRLMTIYPNLMVIPCFAQPLKMTFNLWDLSCHEVRPCFPDDDQWRDCWRHYDDIRPGHLTRENHMILAREIQENLRPGIFQTTYDKFVQVSDIDSALKPKI